MTETAATAGTKPFGGGLFGSLRNVVRDARQDLRAWRADENAEKVFNQETGSDGILADMRWTITGSVERVPKSPIAILEPDVGLIDTILISTGEVSDPAIAALKALGYRIRKAPCQVANNWIRNSFAFGRDLATGAVRLIDGITNLDRVRQGVEQAAGCKKLVSPAPVNFGEMVNLPDSRAIVGTGIVRDLVRSHSRLLTTSEVDKATRYLKALFGLKQVDVVGNLLFRRGAVYDADLALIPLGGDTVALTEFLGGDPGFTQKANDEVEIIRMQLEVAGIKIHPIRIPSFTWKALDEEGYEVVHTLSGVGLMDGKGIVDPNTRMLVPAYLGFEEQNNQVSEAWKKIFPNSIPIPVGGGAVRGQGSLRCLTAVLRR